MIELDPLANKSVWFGHIKLAMNEDNCPENYSSKSSKLL